MTQAKEAGLAGISQLVSWLDLDAARLSGGSDSQRRLSELAGVYYDQEAFQAAVAAGDPLVYVVSGIETPEGAGDLHYGVGRIEAGRVGDEYFMTRGHLHAWRPAAEVYIGLAGHGLMLLEEETTGESRTLPLEEGSIVYVPGGVAHRTINTGDVPLVYLGVWPATAGHDYGSIKERGFRKLVLAGPEGPRIVDRAEVLAARAG
jgi:glucose-6-phosphate isomerase